MKPKKPPHKAAKKQHAPKVAKPPRAKPLKRERDPFVD
jgi:hypothetical protein